jgi:hypothetical protein
MPGTTRAALDGIRAATKSLAWWPKRAGKTPQRTNEQNDEQKSNAWAALSTRRTSYESRRLLLDRRPDTGAGKSGDRKNLTSDFGSQADSAFFWEKSSARAVNHGLESRRPKKNSRPKTREARARPAAGKKNSLATPARTGNRTEEKRR